MNASSTAPVSIESVTLAARDLPALLAFYRDVVGLAVLEETREHAKLGVGETLLLELVSRPDALPDDPREAGLFHTAFLLPSRRDLGRWLVHAQKQGAPVQGASDHIVSEALYLSDPEGNGVEIYVDRDPSEWNWQNGLVEMATHPLGREFLDEALAEGREWDGAPQGTVIGHVHLRVGDIAKAEDFYLGTLGFAKAAVYPGASFVSTGGYHHHFGLNVWSSAGSPPRTADRTGLVRVDLADRREGAEARDLTDPWGTHIRLVAA